MNYFKLGVNEHVNIFMTIPKLVIFSMTFSGLEIIILKFHDFSRFSMSVRTLYIYIYMKQQQFKVDVLQQLVSFPAKLS